MILDECHYQKNIGKIQYCNDMIIYVVQFVKINYDCCNNDLRSKNNYQKYKCQFLQPTNVWESLFSRTFDFIQDRI